MRKGCDETSSYRSKFMFLEQKSFKHNPNDIVEQTALHSQSRKLPRSQYVSFRLFDVDLNYSGPTEILFRLLARQMGLAFPRIPGILGINILGGSTIGGNM